MNKVFAINGDAQNEERMSENRKLRIAVVENDSALLKALGRLLCASGYEPILFISAEAYLECPEKDPADCLLLDIELGDMSGLELQQKLCEDGIQPPIIFITGQSDIPSIGQAIGNGCIAYLHKPFNVCSLLDALRTAALH
jgi:FixJ family two-component response regulator